MGPSQLYSPSGGVRLRFIMSPHPYSNHVTSSYPHITRPPYHHTITISPSLLQPCHYFIHYVNHITISPDNHITIFNHIQPYHHNTISPSLEQSFWKHRPRQTILLLSLAIFLQINNLTCQTLNIQALTLYALHASYHQHTTLRNKKRPGV